MGNDAAPGMGAPTGSFTNAPAQTAAPSLGITDSFVGFIDGAVPRNTVGVVGFTILRSRCVRNTAARFA